MSDRRRWLVLVAAGGVLLAPLGGCGLVTDMFNPGFASSIGLDPATIFPQRGRVVMAFNNTTRFPALFFGLRTVNAQDLAAGAQNFTVFVAAGAQGNEVLDCPAPVIAPGILSGDFEYEPLAAVVFVGGEEVEAVYTGPPLFEGDTFECGDVIEVRLSMVQVGTGDNVEFEFFVSVQILRGS